MSEFLAQGNNFTGSLNLNFGHISLLNITLNPHAHELPWDIPYMFPQYEALTYFGDYLCPGYEVFPTLVLLS